MAIDFQSMLAPLKALSPVVGAGGDSSMERERLRLMREQFEETKRSNLESERYRQIAEAGQMRRAEMQMERERAQQEAAAALAQQKAEADAEAAQTLEQNKLMGDVSKYRDAGDFEGIEALSPRLDQSGMGFERLGEDEAGMPTYRFDMDPEATAAKEAERMATASPYGENETAPQSLNRLSALGYDLDGQERGSLAEPTVTGDELAGRVGAAIEQANTQPGVPIRQPDAPDMMGSVRRDTIDFGAQQGQIARRLNPALGALQSAYPDRYQESVGATNAGVAGLGLPADKALEQAQKMRQGPDAAMARDFATQDDLAKEGRKAEADANKPLDRNDIESLVKSGAAKAKEIYDNNIAGAITRSDAANNIKFLLTDTDPDNDYAIAFELPNMLGSKGSQSNKDLAVALGIDAMSTVDQIVDVFTRMVAGGMSEERKKSLVGVVKHRIELDDNSVYGYLDAIEESASATPDADVARGLREYARGNIPKAYRDAWLKEKGLPPEGANAPAAPAAPGAAGKSAARGVPGDIEPSSDPAAVEKAVRAESEHYGFNPDYVIKVLGGESGFKGTAANDHSSARGLGQFTDETARSYGFKDADEFGALPVTEQIPYVMDYIDKKGLTAKSRPEDYALAFAAPAFIGKPGNTVVYKKDSEQWKANAPWRPADGGDITVDSIAAFSFGKTGAATDEPEAVDDAKEEAAEAAPAAQDEVDQGVLDILKETPDAD